jgi:phage terminase large subunit
VPTSATVELPAWAQRFDSPARYKIAYGGRGSTKSWTFARKILLRGLERPTRVLCARETQKSIAESVHQLLTDQISDLGLGAHYEVLNTEIRGRNGTKIGYAGIRQQGITNLKSYEGADLCWVEEAQVVTKKSWDVLLPTIRKPGSEIWISLNPELDTDETYERFVLNPPEDAIVVNVNWHDNPWFPAVLDQERRTMLARDPVGYETVWEGKCRPAVEGAIYAQEIDTMQREGRVRSVPYDPLLKVHTIWDLGWADSMAIILVQRSTSELRIIGYLSDSYKTLPWYVDQLKALDYNWGQDWIPHDGKARDFKTGKSTEEVLKALGRNPAIVENIGIDEGIRAARLMFPRAWIDREKGRELLNALKRYRRNVTTDGTFGDPKHDEASHGADAWRYLAVVADKLTNSTTARRPVAIDVPRSWMSA